MELDVVMKVVGRYGPMLETMYQKWMESGPDGGPPEEASKTVAQLITEKMEADEKKAAEEAAAAAEKAAAETEKPAEAAPAEAATAQPAVTRGNEPPANPEHRGGDHRRH